ncbi:MAG TPA: signal recognition particle protein [Bacilli bacterium]|nr:signal recognition particle protein [Bacilli bacterium]
MMFEYMGDRIAQAIKNIKGMGRITEENISDALREIRMALLEADVSYQVVKDFIEQVKVKALGMDVAKSLKPEELFIKLVKDELIILLGGDVTPLVTEKKPTVLMLVGLQGSGKTTTAGKIANFMRKKYNKKPLLIAADVYRPAAINQLQEIGKSLNIDVYNEDQKDVNLIVKNALAYAQEQGHDYLIIDTAGRLHIDEQLMQELQMINNNYQPHEVLLVIDAMMGQDAINVITGFNEQLQLTGTILTKLDGDTKGGVALSIKQLTNIPIKLVGDSEKLDGLSEFYPERMAQRILGMGDILAIADKVEGVIDETEAKAQAAKMRKGKYDLGDFLINLKQIKKLGPLENILKMLPQARKLGLNNVNVDPKQLNQIEAMILSMTKAERSNPDILKASRKQRIARGSGSSVEDLNRLLKQFATMKEMIKQVNSGNFKLPQ